MTIVITGSTGKLGRLAIDALLERGVSASEIIATHRSETAPPELQALGVRLRRADFGDAESLDRAFAGADTVLLVSTTDVSARVANHRRAIAAAARSGVTKVVYTSMINAGSAQNLLARTHLATENDLRDSGLSFVILRNGWYLENYTEQLPVIARHGVLLGAAGDGQVSAASRRDYAAAAATVVAGDGHLGATYELAGESFTLAELATAIADEIGSEVVYQNLSQADYAEALAGAGLPADLAGVIADADAGLARGELFSPSTDLATLIGRPPTTTADAVRSAARHLRAVAAR